MPSRVKDILYVNISTFNTSELNVIIYDMMGKRLEGINYRIDKNTLVITVDQLSNGNYILELSGAGHIVRKIFAKD